MKIYGLRIYPQSVKIVRGHDTAIFTHSSVREDCSDFFHAFRPLAPVWRGHLFVKDFGVCYDENMELEDPMPGLREQFGPSLIAADLGSQLMLLGGDTFESWGASMSFCEGAFLPVFRKAPSFELLQRLCWDPYFRLTPETWPDSLRAVLHMWDDIFWQIFTTDRCDLDLLIRSHDGDSRLELYWVDFDHEYPDPSTRKLRPATRHDGTFDA